MATLKGLEMKRAARLPLIVTAIALSVGSLAGCTAGSDEAETEYTDSARVLMTLDPDSVGKNISQAQVLCIEEDAFLVIERRSGGMTSERYEEKDADCTELIEAED